MRLWRLAATGMAIFASVVSGSFEVNAQTFDGALESLALDISATLASESGVASSSVALIRFSAGSAQPEAQCEPLSSRLTEALRRHLSTFQRKLNLPFEVVENSRRARLLIKGQWAIASNGLVEITTKIGDIGVEPTRNLGGPRAMFDVTSLSAQDRQCAFELVTVEEQIKVKYPILVRDAPTPTARVVSQMEVGSTYVVTGRVKGSPWNVVRLSDDDSLPVGHRAQWGFVFRAAETPEPIVRAMNVLSKSQRTLDQQQSVVDSAADKLSRSDQKKNSKEINLAEQQLKSDKRCRAADAARQACIMAPTTKLCEASLSTQQRCIEARIEVNQTGSNLRVLEERKKKGRGTSHEGQEDSHGLPLRGQGGREVTVQDALRSIEE